MTGSGIKRVLTALLIVGLASAGPPGGTFATFSDAHDGEGTFTAVDKFNGGGGGGPNADAGGPYTVGEGGSIWFDGTGSSTPQGNIQSYNWTLVSGPGSGWYYPSQPYAYYEAPDNVNGETQAVVKLTITTNQGQTATDWATITIEDSSGTTTSQSPPGSNGNSGVQRQGGNRESL